MTTSLAVDVEAVAGYGKELRATADELARIAATVRHITLPPHPASPVRLARAAAHLDRALAGPRGLTGLAAGYAALASDARRQAAQLAASQRPRPGWGPVLFGPGWAVADRAAGPVVGGGMWLAAPVILLGRAGLDAAIPEGPGVVREVASPPPAALGSVADLYRRIDTLAPGEVEVVPVRGADGVLRYLVLLRGIDASLNPTVNTPGQAVKSSHRRADAHSRAVLAALRRAGVPAGSPLLVAGHSQGGITALNVAAAGGYRVTHLVTAGSPIANKRAPGVRVLAVEHQGDLVPELDGVEEKSTGSREVYRFGSAGRLTRAADHHALTSGYLPELAGGRFAADPGVRAWTTGAAPYLTGVPAAPRRFRLDAGPYGPDPYRRRSPLVGPGPLGAGIGEV